ncbi:MAG: transglycosylase domain-containing protein [Cyanobacteria bacterium REEB65]|nr:transglycosylase domain-containing protein [Cyanobacteria bacterium REEB65]
MASRMQIACGWIATWLVIQSPATAQDMPRLSDLLKPLPAPHPLTMLFDEAGQRVGEIHPDHNQQTVLLREIPDLLQDALIDTEDPRFRQEGAFDLRGIGRALFHDFEAHKAKEGASTLTQQLARTLLNDREKTLSRKVKEAWVALQLEQQYSKDAILTLYFNEIYWGHGAYGVGAAADRYFERSPAELTLGQMAVLAALVRGPGFYDPYSDKGVVRLVQRQEYVLDRMVAAGHITQQQADLASHREAAIHVLERLAARKMSPDWAAQRLRSYLGIVEPQSWARWFDNRARQEVERQLTRYDPQGHLLVDGAQAVLDDSLKISVTMDPAIQQVAEAAAERGLVRDGRRWGFSQVAIVCIEPATGKVRALVGGLGNTSFDRTLARLQTGSAFKPFVYLAAFERGRTPDDIVDDVQARYPAGPGRWYIPHNDDHRFHGPVSLRVALEQSINSVAVALTAQIGLQPIIELARSFGIVSPLNHDLTLPLGTSAITPLELCSAYAGLANDGVWIPPSIFTQVAAPNGAILERPVPLARRAADSAAVRTLVSVLQTVLGPGGTAAGEGIGRPAAGKTGTTSDFRDAWFVGFTPQLCTAVWVGNDDRKPMRNGAFGGILAARIWHDVMVGALKGKPVVPFAAPPTPAPNWWPLFGTPSASAGPLLPASPNMTPRP